MGEPIQLPPRRDSHSPHGDARTSGQQEAERRQLDELNQLLAPLAPYLLNAELSDIQRNPNGDIIAIFVNGQARQLDNIDISHHRAMQIISTVAALTGREISATHPKFSVTVPGDILPEGSRFTAEIPPISHPGPQFDIRKHTMKRLSLEDYVRASALSPTVAGDLRKCLAARRNILVAGATRSGKTTFANALLGELANMSGPEERIAIIEDNAELQCHAPNYFSWQTDSDSGNTMLALLAQAMRTSPRRICIGELRGEEAVALIQAWGTDHDGGLSTIHGGSAKAALARLEDLYRQSGLEPSKQRVADAVHLVVVIESTPTGRRIREIKRVVGATDRDYIYEDL